MYIITKISLNIKFIKMKNNIMEEQANLNASEGYYYYVEHINPYEKDNYNNYFEFQVELVFYLCTKFGEKYL